MRLYLVRHGESENNAGLSSAHNVHLTSRGERQLHIAGKALSKHALGAIYCSPLERALQSAAILRAAMGVKTYVHPSFAEVGFCWGEPETRRREFESAYPEFVFDLCITDQGWSPADRETEEQAYDRAGHVADWLGRRHPEPKASILVVSHGRFGSILIGRLLGSQPCGYSRFGQNNGGISLVECSEEQTILRFLNATDHLPVEMLT